MLMALVRAFRTREQQEAKEEAQGKSTGMARYRRQLEFNNRDKVLVRVGDRYGIFPTWVLMVLVGVRVWLPDGQTPEKSGPRACGADPTGMKLGRDDAAG